MALSTLRFHRKSKDDVDTMLKGQPIFAGEASKYHEWEFRTLLKIGATEEGKEYKTLDSIVNGLKSDALQVAMDARIGDLVATGGLTPLVDMMKELVFLNLVMLQLVYISQKKNVFQEQVMKMIFIKILFVLTLN